MFGKQQFKLNLTRIRNQEKSATTLYENTKTHSIRRRGENETFKEYETKMKAWPNAVRKREREKERDEEEEDITHIYPL